MIKAIWPDGISTTGADATEVLRIVREKQWREYTNEQFRREMARRARIWSGIRIRIGGSDDEFLDQLVSAGLVKVMVRNAKP